ncbi:MAG: hypothetical protein ACD_42C00151G0003 [uncultured bacterium]|nr:MAG: hypothetical protein ACD_42C00151G0003 [uncultured bacterium]OGT26043.1 MAG: hypothetical protein A3B71_07650 [Gammaproteobacteria bacterium RIFCSPHIGHO2_02_FULL_42_43]OGT27391.1 MAG: hypothetical protein A2624_05790 [Gammaproteobacteria bacterium RIFCSPHIGHO2_01_FULL_42_8]OGT52294.1 MAG: hypothetical protein A3E54_01525 [Gammaproteobacteria bacterium RIFCSPHIGHO2_12_FULL_41_25]OGT61906.1 MAG: hypothetical protein A3I77_01465 [Gammaproteobacteria bacterium RIFCSPLOWO2_02_FULL_42_14]OGT
MRVSHETPVHYYLNDQLLNPLIGKMITLEFTGVMECLQCHRKITKTFQQGYCYPCFQRILECNNCMIHPERCLVEQGKCVATDWAHEQCHQKHIVYLANTSALKVGITRESNIPARWIDQGAVQALPIFQTQNRYQAGLIEVALKNFVADKTNWRLMLKNSVEKIDLIFAKKIVLQQARKNIDEILKKYSDEIILSDNQRMYSLEYPVLQYLEKVNALSFDKMPVISGKLLGIKGQYLILEQGVLNVRKHGGYCAYLR